MEREYFLPLLDTMKLCIFWNLDFETLLVARLVCFEWNELISSKILHRRSKLNIQLDKSKMSRKFRKGKWSSTTLSAWEEISIYYPEDASPNPHPTFYWGIKSPFQQFSLVKKLILFDYGKACFLDYVHSMLAGLGNVREVIVSSHHWQNHSLLKHQNSLSYQTKEDSWKCGIERAASLTVFKIGIYDKRRTIKYLNFLNLIDANLSLVTLDVDLSKNAGLPFDPMIIDEVYQVLSNLIQNCAGTLENLRIKWDHRVESDVELVQYARDFDPFVQFILMISSNRDVFNYLKLKKLVIQFPIVLLNSINLINDNFVPFLRSQESSLEKLVISRVRWDNGVRSFLANFKPGFSEKIELGIFMVDVDRWVQTGVKLAKAVSKIEYHGIGTTVFDLNSINARKTRCRKSGVIKWKRHVLTSLRFRNSTLNKNLELINIKEILHNFRMLSDLELLDHSEGSERRPFSNSELNKIFLVLTRLKSLKISNLSKITDAGILLLLEKDVARMKDVGVYYWTYPTPPKNSIPMLQAKNLKYLEFRDLSQGISDVLVYFAIQNISKLEKVALYGQHNITDWGKVVLQKQFKRNPCFEVFIGTNKNIPETDLYLVDFP